MTREEVERFVAEATEFLDARASRRAVRRDDWGAGSDRVPLLEDSDPDTEAEELAAAKRWRAEVFDSGFGWLGGPVRYGGGGRDAILDDAYRALEAGYDVPPQGFFGIGRSMLAPAILEHGSPDLKDRYLRALLRGDLIACQLFSEPGAGSDLAAASTRAVRDGDDWVITGQKVWSSFAQVADVGELLVRTDREAPKHHGLTMFVLDMSQRGVEVRPLRQINGGTHFNEVFLDGVRVPDRDRIGEPGSGWRVARTTLLSERGAVGGSQVGVYVDRLRDLARHLGRTDEPITRQRLADVYAVDRALARLNEQIAARHDGGPLGSISKLVYSRQLRRVADAASELLGPAIAADTGEWGTFAWAELMLSAPGLRIAGGTDEIMLSILAEQVLGLPREPRAR